MRQDFLNPIFGGASTQQDQGDEFDLEGIFDDDFQDPMNAYVASMASYAGGSVSVGPQGIPLTPAAQVHDQVMAARSALNLPSDPGPAKKRKADEEALWSTTQDMLEMPDATTEKRERNRVHAKRSRVRKKFMLESLQEEVAALQAVNKGLRTLVQDKIPGHAQKIISECCEQSTMFGDGGADKDSKGKTAIDKSDFQLMQSLSSGQQNFVLTDPRKEDNPVIFASPGFYKMTGYTQDKVVGKNCRFLQGPGTNPRTIEIMRKAMAAGSDCTVCLMNYKADGTPFWNQIFIAPLRDSDNQVVNFVGVLTEVNSSLGTEALEERVNSALPLTH